MAADLFLPSLTPQSTLAELPTWDVRLPVTARGDAFDEVLRRQPDLPGVVVFDTTGVRGAISRTRFHQVISRPFGGEIVRPRAIGALLGEFSSGDLMILDVNMPVQEALRESLARDKSMIYEPVLISTNGGKDVRLVGFTDLLRADSRISSLRNQQMQEILATVQEGFLLVDRDHRIAWEYSRSVETILGRSNLAGCSLTELLRDLLGSEAAQLGLKYLEALFNPNVIEKLVVDINPLKSVKVPEHPGRPRQHLGFAFRRSFEGREIRRVLVRVEDRTREVELAAELEEQERQAGQRVDLAMEMMQVDADSLTDYLTRFLVEVSQISRLRSQPAGGSTRAAVDAIFRILHSLKGEAGVIGLRSFAQRLHRAEDVVASVRDSGTGQGSLERLDPWIESLRELGVEARDLIVRLSALVSNKAPREVTSRPADIVPALEALIADLSTRLGKAARFVARWNPEDLPVAYGSVVRESLIQLTRNSMVHGVETERQRRQAGKPVPAVLQFALRRHEAEGQLEVLFQDDGRGLDLDQIRCRARDLFGSEDLDDEEAAQIIFEPGFSTALTTNGDAGRGVGLDLVRDRVESLGGMVLVHSEPGVFCAFQIVLPLEPEGRS
ncbi:MAG TPA: ATP-binding protein [Thermoanaerobaculia bacterium]|jgi:two-component system chemotaxis sensor kinase CheA|nr:ATP-binding protein [Thermoanaerobaculia bacterium]